MLRADLLHDVGRSLNPAVDIGQVEGAFVQGMGWLTMEELRWDEGTGRLLTLGAHDLQDPDRQRHARSTCARGSSTVPSAVDTIHRSKAVGEPPLLLAFSVFLAIRDAVARPRGDRVDPVAAGPGDARGDPPGSPFGTWRCVMTYEISLVELPEQDVAVVRGHVAVDGIGEFLGGAFGEIMGALDGVEIVGPPFARYAMPDEGFDVMAGFPVSAPVTHVGRVEADRLPGGPAATTMHVGSYEAVAAAFEAVQGWVAAARVRRRRRAMGVLPRRSEVPEPRTLVTFPVRPA